MKNIFAVSSNTYHGFTLNEALAGIAQAGFKYVELNAVRGYTEHVRWEMDDEAIREVKKALSKYELEAIALSAHSNLMRKDGVENFIKSIKLAKRLGCQYIVTATGEAHGDKDEIEDEQKIIDTLKKIVHKCEENQITLVLETHGNNYATGKHMGDLVKKVDSEYIGINYDTGNVIFYGNVKPEKDLEDSIEKVKFMHLKDKTGENQEWNFPAIGQGEINFTKIFQILKGKNYQGPISVEIEFTPEGPGSLEYVNKAVKDSYSYLQNFM
ncbi:sugar phosphate isomerase/epimerase [Clostridiaceae bacterium 35-E11]